MTPLAEVLAMPQPEWDEFLESVWPQLPPPPSLLAKNRRRYHDLRERLVTNSVLGDAANPKHVHWDGSLCWIWIGGDNGRYGKMDVRKRRGPNKGKSCGRLAHREALKIFRGIHLSTKSVARHECDNSFCINPWHLRGGTPKQNTRDMIARGRHFTPFRHLPEGVEPVVPDHMGIVSRAEIERLAGVRY